MRVGSRGRQDGWPPRCAGILETGPSEASGWIAALSNVSLNASMLSVMQVLQELGADPIQAQGYLKGCYTPGQQSIQVLMQEIADLEGKADAADTVLIRQLGKVQLREGAPLPVVCELANARGQDDLGMHLLAGQTVCPICMEGKRGYVVRVVPCQHWVHLECAHAHVRHMSSYATYFGTEPTCLGCPTCDLVPSGTLIRGEDDQ
eukprot:5950440-Pyramimonas_sp.AAC.1